MSLGSTSAALAIWLVVPVKPLDEGKSRLAAALSLEERAALSRRWLLGELRTAQASSCFAGLAVISRDETVLALAAAQGAVPIRETGEMLNAALEQARHEECVAGADALLVLPSDLPLLTVGDLHALVELGAAGAGVVIAPSHDGGTNALLLRPPHAIPYAFGEGSYARHVALAAAAGLPCHTYRSDTLAWDVDYPEDLRVAAL
ncbi:MAG: 2-phospho-L-lactate guanylyltransferase [Chloroflexi bacterium]|nr:MAG: 2-phospho-L-lactate guanylyltransferase [Chloroflexota bacterium]